MLRNLSLGPPKPTTRRWKNTAVGTGTRLVALERQETLAESARAPRSVLDQRRLQERLHGADTVSLRGAHESAHPQEEHEVSLREVHSLMAFQRSLDAL